MVRDDFTPVAVTGVGVLSAAGLGRDAFWQALCDGRPRFAPFAAPLDRLAPGFGGVAEPDKRGFRDLPGTRPLRPSTMTRYTWLSTFGLGSAARDGDLQVDDLPDDEARRRGLFVGSYVNLPEMDKYVQMAYAVRDRAASADGRYVIDESRVMDGMRKFTGFEYLRLMNNMPVAHGGIQVRCKGPCNTFMGGSQAALQAVGRAAAAIATDQADEMIAGGTGSACVEHSLIVRGYLGQLVPSGTAPAVASRPFDRAAAGIVPGEGSAFVVLQSTARAAARGARVRAWLSGYGTAFAVPASSRGPAASPDSMVAAGRTALARSGVSRPDAVVVAGTGLPAQDAAEAAALSTLLGASFADTPVVTVTPVLGFAEAAHGAFSLAAAVEILDRGALPPTVGLRDPIPGFSSPARGDVTPFSGRAVLVVAFAPEGNSAAVVLTAAA